VRYSLCPRKLANLSLSLVYISFLASCNKPPELRPEKRPAGVPNTAEWAGGADGGAYIQCAIDLQRNVNPCTVWNDYTGQVMESGDYKIAKQDRAAATSELKFVFADFDGTIQLKNGLSLTRIGH
jgi:hypothetical protein